MKMAKIDFGKTTLSKTAAKFITTFLRFEFALKESGFCPESGDALVEWHRVGLDLGKDFFDYVRASGKAATLVNRPPKKQVMRNHQLEWRTLEPPRNVDELLLAVRRVRNNLFHGGKSGDPEYDADNPSRSTTLIREAQWVVEQAILRIDDVKVHFEGRY